MSTQYADFGELTLAFTTDFSKIWTDKGSGADKSGSFWQPKPPAGFHALGSVARPDHTDPSGKTAALCVKQTHANGNALAAPTDYERIWKDSGSDADSDGSCWRPIPPKGYVALGDVFMKDHSKKPSTDLVRCVREDLTLGGKIGDKIWTDKGSGADENFGCWEIDAPSGFVSDEDGCFAVGTFVGRDEHDKPSNADVAHVLRLPIPTQRFEEPQPPRLTGPHEPPRITTPVVDSIITLPFTALTDHGLSEADRAEKTPFYRVEREVSYTLLIYVDNPSSVSQAGKEVHTVGVTKTESSDFSVKTGISVSAEAGVSLLGSGGKVSATVSVELGWSTSTSVAQFAQTTKEYRIEAPARTAAALWVKSYTLYAVRADGTRYAAPLAFDVNSIVTDDYALTDRGAGDMARVVRQHSFGRVSLGA